MKIVKSSYLFLEIRKYQEVNDKDFDKVILNVERFTIN